MFELMCAFILSERWTLYPSSRFNLDNQDLTFVVKVKVQLRLRYPSVNLSFTDSHFSREESWSKVFYSIIVSNDTWETLIYIDGICINGKRVLRMSCLLPHTMHNVEDYNLDKCALVIFLSWSWKLLIAQHPTLNWILIAHYEMSIFVIPRIMMFDVLASRCFLVFT